MAEVHERIAAEDGTRLHQVCERMRSLSEMCTDTTCTCQRTPFHHQTMAVSGMGSRSYREIYPGLSDGHTFVIFATCYFIKWVEAKPLKSPTQEAVIIFFKEYIVHRHGLPESITTDQGTMFTGGDIVEWASQMKIKMVHSTTYYEQANGQAEATNKAIKFIVRKMIEENPRQWHVLLSEAVWANRTSQNSATGTSPFRMVFGHDAMLPMELTVMSTRRLYQNKLSKDDYFDKMILSGMSGYVLTGFVFVLSER
ncbi:uncharacterized protein LOC126681638 [Mercurialis annua]|uniref:uncharacterized protein LOC126681638 n=1 Tax=Mercurialis annua TaxID=3986 RepID=UPI00216105CA|nr:uncharacterized protein LOC126681638 [Mercurialis annua]